jgi:chromosome segregation ATPase
MEEGRKKQLRRQLEQQAAQLTQNSGSELSIALVNACAALLKAAAEESSVQSMDELDFDDLNEGYRALARSITAFGAQASKRLGGVQDPVLTQATEQNLQKLMDAGAELTKQQEALQQQIVTQEQENKRLSALVEQQKSQIENAENTNRALKDKMQEYAPERLAQLEATNAQLFNSVQQAHQTLEAITKTKEQHQQELDELEQQITALQAEIDQMPEESKQLAAEQKSLAAALDDLRHAEERFGSEQQNDLRKQIDELTPRLEQDQAEFEKLTEKLTALQQANQELEEQEGTLESEALTQIEGVIRALRPQLEERREALEQVHTTVQELEESLRTCNQQRRQYRAWFEADRTPLEALEQALGYPESKNLRNTMNVAQCEGIHNAFERIRKELQDLDDTLRRCMEAYGKDEIALLDLVRKRS